MKKMLALVLALLMMLGACAAAETAAIPYEGGWVQFEEGFEVYLPLDWNVLEVPEVMQEAGIFYIAASPDNARTFQVAWGPLEVEATIEELQAELVTVYTDATIIETNGIKLMAYTDAPNNLMGTIMMDPAEPGFYMFFFTPGDDVEYQTIAGFIAASVRYIQ